MLISCNRLKKYIKDSNTIDWLKIWDIFTIRTAEVENVTTRGNDLDNVVTAKIIECKKHPESNKLSLLKVSDGTKEYNIVCGAPNVRVGLIGALVRDGGMVSGFKIKTRNLAGYPSEGMMCAVDELGIGTDHEGILELPSDTPIGVDFKTLYPVEDIIVEIDNKSLTNRPDLWGHYGIAREICAITNHELLPLDLLEIENNQNDLVTAEEQNSFLNSTLGKVVDSALDIGLRMIMPDFLEENVVEVKDAFLQGGFKEGVDSAINGAIDLGKSIMGIFTGEFDNISQARDAVKNGGIIDGISSVLDKIIDKTSDSGIISSNVANLISNGKDAILNSVNSNIENEFMEQINGVDLLAKYEDNWKECFENKDFEGMQREYEKIEDKLEALMPLESTLKEARVIENLHNLIKNNGQDFNLTKEQLELSQMLS